MSYLLSAPALLLAVGLLLWWFYSQQQRLNPEQLRAWREDLGLSQNDMAERISSRLKKSLHPKTLRRWEQGKTKPHPKNYVALQRTYEQDQALLLRDEMKKLVEEWNSTLRS